MPVNGWQSPHDRTEETKVLGGVMTEELIEEVALGFIMSWADAQDGDNTLHPDSALMKLVDAHEDRDAIIQSGYRLAVDRFVTNVKV
jgi:hypothetical protein